MITVREVLLNAWMTADLIARSTSGTAPEAIGRRWQSRPLDYAPQDTVHGAEYGSGVRLVDRQWFLVPKDLKR